MDGKTRNVAATAVVLWTVLSLLERVLVGRLDVEETPVGIVIALLATIVTLSGASLAKANYTLDWRWLWLPLLVVRNVVRDTFTVYGVLFRRLAGGRVEDAMVEIPFDPGGVDPRSAARRALATAGISTSPNEIVLDIDSANGMMRVHALKVTNARRHSAQWPL